MRQTISQQMGQAQSLPELGRMHGHTSFLSVAVRVAPEEVPRRPMLTQLESRRRRPLGLFLLAGDLHRELQLSLEWSGTFCPSRPRALRKTKRVVEGESDRGLHGL